MMNSEYSKVAIEESGINEESLIDAERPDDDAAVVTSAVPMMKVTAPAMLPEGYELEVDIGSGCTMKVSVPKGGVAEGQVFEVPFVPPSNNASNNNEDSTIRIPVGHWRDGICGCFSHGICHPHMWTSCCCHLCE